VQLNHPRSDIASLVRRCQRCGTDAPVRAVCSDRCPLDSIVQLGQASLEHVLRLQVYGRPLATVAVSLDNFLVALQAHLPGAVATDVGGGLQDQSDLIVREKSRQPHDLQLLGVLWLRQPRAAQLRLLLSVSTRKPREHAIPTPVVSAAHGRRCPPESELTA